MLKMLKVLGGDVRCGCLQGGLCSVRQLRLVLKQFPAVMALSVSSVVSALLQRCPSPLPCTHRTLQRKS